MFSSQFAARPANGHRYAELATTVDAIRASQALRYRVFAQGLGATGGRNRGAVVGARGIRQGRQVDVLFGCADILVLVKVHEIDASYRRHFLDRVMKG